MLVHCVCMFRRLLAVATAIALLMLPAVPSSAHVVTHRPIIFVHGFSGGAEQYETQAKRFASNGYPAGSVQAFEYDSTFTINTIDQVYANLDVRISDVLAATHTDQVDLTAHSLGTALMLGYLNSSPARAARVAHYVNYDGAAAIAPPGGVPTLAIWGEGPTTREITGATNLYLSDQSHTQTVTSPESFQAVFRFLTGRDPRVTRVLPELFVTLAGRAVLFPVNAGVPSGHLEIYPLNPLTGHRLTARPVAVYPLGGDGSWGPFRGLGAARYEFAIVRPGASTHHFYYEPFVRSDRLIRLLTSNPGEGLGTHTETSDATTNLIVNRGKEWWGDQGDALFVHGVDVLNGATAPRSKRVIGIFAYDVSLDGVTDVGSPIPYFFAQPFITGVDVSLPAAAGGRGTVPVVAKRRGDNHVDYLAVPNWPSTTDSISLQFDDGV
jgi:pimeloyl-ACP methyl ester carboxylesterase